MFEESGSDDVSHCVNILTVTVPEIKRLSSIVPTWCSADEIQSFSNIKKEGILAVALRACIDVIVDENTELGTVQAVLQSIKSRIQETPRGGSLFVVLELAT